jgi:hypothetical protein
MGAIILVIRMGTRLAAYAPRAIPRAVPYGLPGISETINLNRELSVLIFVGDRTIV